MHSRLSCLITLSLFIPLLINADKAIKTGQHASEGMNSHATTSNEENIRKPESNFFNTQFLVQYDKVEQALIIEEGFEKVDFKSTDGLTLKGLYKKVEGAPYTMIFAAGFYPGRKEGLATYTKMLKDNPNILLYDARGHGKSDGRLFSNLANYGVDEYKDVIGALECAQKQNPNGEIKFFGTCAGAFHVARALGQIDCKKEKVTGFVYDSGYVTMLDIKPVPGMHFKEKVIPALLKSWIYKKDTKEQIKQRFLCKGITAVSNFLFSTFVKLITKRYELREKTMNLTNSIKKITCPIFYVHSHDDSYSPIESVKKLAEQTENKQCWWIEKPSEHATHHLKHTEQYKQKLADFLSTGA
jgi:pimeloyl-ACP methyl ester carboxylesterase